MKTLVGLIVLAVAASAGATEIPKWRTPGGTLHFGDNPPAGSVLLGRIAGVERDAAPLEEERERLREARKRAAADGREIIRRRADEREAARERKASVARQTEVADDRGTVHDRDVVIVTPSRHHFHPQLRHPAGRFHPPIGFERPKPERKPFHRLEKDRPKPGRRPASRFEERKNPTLRSTEARGTTSRFQGGRLSVAP